jgi:hypothetical protein
MILNRAQIKGKYATLRNAKNKKSTSCIRMTEASL